MPDGAVIAALSGFTRRAVRLLFVAAAVLAVAPLLATHTSDVGVGRVAVSFHPSLRGSTDMVVPPLGRVSAPTHSSPVEMRFELRSVNVAGLVNADGRVDTGQMREDVRHDLPAAVRASVIKLAIVGGVVGAVVGLLVWQRRWRTPIAGAAVGVLTVGAFMASVVPGFDTAEFDDLAFKGSLASGSAVLASVTRSPTSDLGQRIGALSDRLSALYSASLTRELGDDDDTLILHISDLHLNPIGLELARRLAESFGVDAVLDTGDTTSFGSPFEGSFADLLADFPVPYLYVGGNHDSPANRAAIAAAPGVEAIDRRVVQIGDVRILGFDDPLVTTTERIERSERERVERDAAPELASLARRTKPDVIAAHNPVILEQVVGTAPVAVAGHLHRFELGARGGTLISVVGSMGATGLGSLLSEADLPYAAAVLRFRGDTLIAIDRIEVVGTSGDLEVRRHSITDEDRDGDNATFIGGDVDEAVASEMPVAPSADPTTTRAPTATTDSTPSTSAVVPTTAG